MHSVQFHLHLVHLLYIFVHERRTDANYPPAHVTSGLLALPWAQEMGIEHHQTILNLIARPRNYRPVSNNVLTQLEPLMDLFRFNVTHLKFCSGEKNKVMLQWGKKITSKVVNEDQGSDAKHCGLIHL